MVAKSIAVLILVVACASVQARSSINGVFMQVRSMKEARAVPHVPHPHAKKMEVVYKAGVGCEDCDDCDDDHECDPAGDAGYPDDASCCPHVINDCDQDRLFICCDPCTGNICGTSLWACEQDAENSLACQNRNKMRFLKTIQL